MNNSLKFSACLILVSGAVVLFMMYTGSRDDQLRTRKEVNLESSQERAMVENGGEVQASGKTADRSGKDTIIRKKGIDLEEVRRRMAIALSIKDISERTIEATKIIQNLCESGQIEEAWSMITNDAGQVRTSQIHAFFASSDLTPTQLVEWVKLVQFEGEKSLAVSGYIRSVALADLVATLQNEPVKGLVDEINSNGKSEAIKNGVAGKILVILALPGDREIKQQAVDTSLALHSAGLLNDQGLSSIIKNDSSRNEFDKYRLLTSKIAYTNPKTERGQYRKELVQEMVIADSEKAMSDILLTKGEQGKIDMIEGITKLAALDPGAANKWFEDNQSRMSGEQRDSASIGFFRLALHYKEMDGARQWADQIQDPKLREWAASLLGNPHAEERK